MPRYFRLDFHAAPWGPGDRWRLSPASPRGTREPFWSKGEHPVGTAEGTGSPAVTQRLGLEVPPSAAGPLALCCHLLNAHPVGCAGPDVLEGEVRRRGVCFGIWVNGSEQAVARWSPLPPPAPWGQWVPLTRHIVPRSRVADEVLGQHPGTGGTRGRTPLDNNGGIAGAGVDANGHGG